MRYILNSAVITGRGQYDYRHITIEEAKAWLHAGHWRSTIRYPETAAALAALVGIDVAVRNEAVTMQPGDEALVFRLAFPPGAGRIEVEKKGTLNTQFVLENCEIGLLKMIK